MESRECGNRKARRAIGVAEGKTKREVLERIRVGRWGKRIQRNWVNAVDSGVVLAGSGRPKQKRTRKEVWDEVGIKQERGTNVEQDSESIPVGLGEWVSCGKCT